MIKEPKYLVKFTHAYNDNGTIWYTVSVISAKQNESWTFKERYSRMRMIHENMEKTKWKNDLPMFPPRKLFGNTNPEFIQKRKKQLQNYYSTLFRTVSIDQLPECLAFFNTNKPVKEKIKSNTVTVSKNNNNEVEPSSSPIKPEKKQKQMKKIFQQIVAKTQQAMVESNEFDPQIEDEVRRKFNHEFQKLKLDLKSPLIDSVNLPKGDKENDTDFWNQFFIQSHEQNLKKLTKISSEVASILKEAQKCQIKFVVPL